MEATLGLSESVSPSQQVDTTGSTSKMNTRLSPTVHRQGSSQSPLNKSVCVPHWRHGKCKLEALILVLFKLSRPVGLGTLYYETVLEITHAVQTDIFQV